MLSANRLSIFIFVVLAFMSTQVLADTRYALIIGANEGDPSETRLQYAERDAKRVADVLTQLGNFEIDNTISALGKDGPTILKILHRLNKRIANEGDKSAMLFVFYSGHADPNALHLSGTRLKFSALRKQLDESPAAIKVVMIDACKSGEFTRVKGVAPADAFDIEASRWKSGTGMAVITSSAAGEDAQESDKLRAGYFTHFLVSGLRGAADSSQDGAISLAEVYQFVYDETLRATSTASLVQHPTYEFDIRGRADITLTRLRTGNTETGILSVEDAGHYLFFENDEKGNLVAEVQVSSNTKLALSAGKYFIRRRIRGRVFEGDFEIESKEQLTIDESGLRQLPQGEIARKGIGQTAAWGLAVSGGMGQNAIPEFGFSPYIAAGFRSSSFVLFEALGKFATAESQSPTLTIDHQLFGLESTLAYTFEFESFVTGLGVRGNAGVIRQTLDSRISASKTRLGFYGGLGPVGIFEYETDSSVSFGLRTGFDILLLPRETTSVVVAPFGGIHVVSYF